MGANGSAVDTAANAAQAEIDIEADAHDADEFSPPESTSALISRWACQFATLFLVAMMGAEMILRSAFNWSIQWSNEIGGYALVAITFLSMASGQYLHAYHRVHFLESRVGPVAKAGLRLLFDIGALAVALILFLEFVRFEWITWKSGDVAPTSLLTPLWIPRLAMPIGAGLLVWALLHTIAGDLRRVRAARAAAGGG